MTDDMIISIALILVPILISRFMLEKALGKLDGEMKLKLLDGFSKQRKYRLFIVIPCMFIYLLSLRFFEEQTVKIVVFAGILLSVYFVIGSVVNYRKIRALGVPESYSKTYKWASMIVAAGFIAFAVQLFIMLNRTDEEDDTKYKAWEMAMKGVEDMKQGNYRTAIADITKAIELDSTVVSSYMNRGASFYNIGMMKEAEKDWKKAVSMGNMEAARWLKNIPE
ncbi:MAG: hypothetical protein JWO44_2591 [Bacteroidetes bacterium]|nr:hypothetical protein [Bacteroidota bacterium]